MGVINYLFRRDSTNPSTAPDDMQDSMFYGPPVFALLSLFLLTSCCVVVLLYLRRSRRLARQQENVLPQYHRSGHHRTLTITTTPLGTDRRSIFVYDEKMNLIANSNSPPSSPVPEIHVTFPEEEQQNGQRTGGRVVVLRISDTGSVGMEPLHQEPLPPYQRNESERFQSLDLERMGGLREKPVTGPRYS